MDLKEASKYPQLCAAMAPSEPAPSGGLEVINSPGAPQVAFDMSVLRRTGGNCRVIIACLICD